MRRGAGGVGVEEVGGAGCGWVLSLGLEFSV